MAGSCLLIDQSRYCQVTLAGQVSWLFQSMSLIVIKLPKIGSYRHIYFEAYAEVERRFDQTDIQKIQKLEFLLVQAAKLW